MFENSFGHRFSQWWLFVLVFYLCPSHPAAGAALYLLVIGLVRLTLGV